ATGGYERGGQCRKQERTNRSKDIQRIGGCQTVQEFFQVAGYQKRKRQSDNDARAYQQKYFVHDQRYRSATAESQGDPDPDFLSTSRNAVADDAVETDH